MLRSGLLLTAVKCVLCNMALFVFQSPGEGGQDLFLARFEPQILAAMSRHVAVFPPARPDDAYPPQVHKSSPSSPNSPSPLTLYRNQILASKQKSWSPERTADTLKTDADSIKANGSVTLPKLNTKGAVIGKCSERSVQKLLQRRPTMRYVLNPVDFVPQNGVNTTLRPARLPLSNETLASLTTFCFPGTSVHSTFTLYFCCLVLLQQTVIELDLSISEAQLCSYLGLIGAFCGFFLHEQC